VIVIIWSIIPLIEKFVQLGPLLTPDQQPRLFSELSSLAKSTSQEMPSEVYIIPDLNAGVSQVGRTSLYKNRRIMVIGLPLLKVLTVSQLRAVLAHEFGHYCGGDIKLGPWVFKTRATIISTLWRLRGHPFLQLPFIGYAMMFLRITQSVSRQQELSADAVAARIAGPQTMASALQKIQGAAPAWEAYWMNEVFPVFRAGYMPPLADGFGRFIQSNTIILKVNQIIEKETSQSQTNPYDSHPSLHDRIAAIHAQPIITEPSGEPPAISLINNIPQIEINLLERISKIAHIEHLTPASWDDLIKIFHIPAWESNIKQQKLALEGVKPEDLPELARNLGKFESKIMGVFELPLQQRLDYGNHLIGEALTLALFKKGWTVNTAPGEEVSVTLKEQTLFPFKIFPDLASGTLTGEQWIATVIAIGIAGTDLSKVA
jgi:Zn-dependent protease with chaperone function